jgi:hypothetical protein
LWQASDVGHVKAVCLAENQIDNPAAANIALAAESYFPTLWISSPP